MQIQFPSSFYRFYTHSYADRSTVYERMLYKLPPQAFGFSQPKAKPRQ